MKIQNIQYKVLSNNSQEINDLLVQAKNEGKEIIGLEVIDQKLQSKLDRNIDPQHTEGRNDTSAIDYVFKNIDKLVNELKGKDVLFVTSRADLDSVGAMALLTMALAGLSREELSAIAERVQKINVYDNYTKEPKWTPKPIPEAVHTNKEFGPLNNAIADFKVPLEKRVETMGKWLLTGEEPKEYVSMYEQELKTILEEIESGNTTIEHIVKKKVAIVKSKLSKAIDIGYSTASGVIAYNPEFDPNGTGVKQLKFSIAQFPGMKIFNFDKIKAELNKIDPNVSAGNSWGGPPNLLASPMGTGTGLTPEGVIEIALSGVTEDDFN